LDRPFKELVEHACCDADMALRLYAVLTKELRKRCAEQHFLDEPMRVERLLIERERDGVRIDMGRMKAVGRAVKASAEALRAAAIAAAGCEFRAGSFEHQIRMGETPAGSSPWRPLFTRATALLRASLLRNWG